MIRRQKLDDAALAHHKAILARLFESYTYAQIERESGVSGNTLRQIRLRMKCGKETFDLLSKMVENHEKN